MLSKLWAINQSRPFYEPHHPSLWTEDFIPLGGTENSYDYKNCSYVQKQVSNELSWVKVSLLSSVTLNLSGS